MYFISGAIFISASIVMFFFIDLFSRIFPQEVMLLDEDVMQGYFSTGSLLFPLISGILGIFLILLQFILKGKTK